MADFDRLLVEIRDLLRVKRRLSYTGLQSRFGLSEAQLEAVRDELIHAQRQARDEDGKVLVWEERFSPQPWSLNQTPPPHLAEKILAERNQLAGERKQVSVLFCDVVGSVALTNQLGMATWQPILKDYLKLLGQSIYQHEGTVGHYRGDGLMALFGAPIAHEDHAVRACLAALDALKQLRPFTQELERLHQIKLRTRMGIHSGDVVFGRIGDDLNIEYRAVGQTVTLCEQIEKVAEPDSCFLSKVSAEMVDGYIEYELAGNLQAEAGKQDWPLFKLTASKADKTRLDLARERGLTPFVGRDAEMGLLEHGLRHAISGHGQTVAIAAPAGIGKSRLCWEFKQRCREQGIPVYSAYGAPHGNQRAYEAIKPLYRSIYGIDEEGLTDAEARTRISHRLLSLHEKAAAALPELYGFLGVPDPDNPPPNTPPELQRRLYLDFTRWSFRLIGQNAPMVILLDDLHWFDEASLGMVQVLLETVSDTRTLVVTNFRPELKTEWLQNQPNLQRLSLQPLDEGALRELVTDLLGTDASLEGLPEKIIETSSGNPFFVEEIVRDLIDNQLLNRHGQHYQLHQPLDHLPLPASLQSLLAARIDRLPDADKYILQTAAVIGRNFAADLLAAVSGLPTEEIDAAMQRLRRADFVFEVGDEPGTQWCLKHALTEEVAYASLLKSKRRSVHAEVAAAMAAQCGKEPKHQAAIIAYHWEAAGELGKAAKATHKAARWAHKIDLRESLRHRQDVLRLIDGLDETPELLHIGIAARRELTQWVMISGIDPETAENYFHEGCAIAERTGDFITLGTLIGAYALLETQRARFSEGMALTNKCTGMLKNIKHAEINATMDGVIFGTAYGSAGRVREAREATERALVLTEENPNLGAIAAFNIRMWASMLHGMTHGACGHPTEGIAELAELAPQAFQDRESGAVPIVGFVAWLRHYSGDTTDMAGLCEKAVRYAERTEIGYWRGAARSYYGINLLTHGRWAEAREQFAAVRELNRHHHFMEYYDTLASIYLPIALLHTGQQNKAQRLAEKAREMAETSDSYFFINDACWVFSQVVRQTQGQQAAEALRANLQRWQQCLDDSGIELCRHLWLWESALLAELNGDAEGYRQGLEQALASAEKCGANGHAEQIRQAIGG